MKNRLAYDNIIDLVELPKIIKLNDNLYGSAFFLMKLMPARFILDRAEKEGILKPGSLVTETTSGTFGLALAMLCSLKGYKFVMVTDPVVDDALKRRIEDLGAVVEIVQKPADIGGYQRSRLDKLMEILKKNPGSFCPSQYENTNNPAGYSKLAEILAESVGHIDCLVGTVGSGGSVCGTSRYLRQLFPDLHVVGVDTLGSVIFGQPDQKRLLRGLGNSLWPDNVDHTVFNEIHWVSAAEAFLATRMLHRKHALFMGGTSGAAYMVAKWWAEKNPGKIAVSIFPDEGYRYQDTIYNDKWLEENNVKLDKLPKNPVEVKTPVDAKIQWSCIGWNRRDYENVVGKPKGT